MKNIVEDYRKSINPPYRKNDFFAIGVTFLVLVIALFTAFSIPNQFKGTYTKQQHAAGLSSCQLQSADPGANVAFCDTFDNPMPNSPGPNRSGDLDGNVWGVSRTVGNVNFGGSGLFNAAPPTTLVGCNGTSTVTPPHDVIICNGQLREATNDNPSGVFEEGGVTALAMYPKQPFDFAGRTGTVVFDVGNDTHGSHAAWPEFWMSNLPIPAPFEHFFTWIALPQFGFGIKFDGYVDGNGNANPCPEGPGYVGVGSAILINNYTANDFDNAGNSVVIHGSACVKQPTSPGQLNHYEIRVSQSQIDVYGTDAGTTTPLKHLATILNANLGFTRGLIWLEDVHYNADKGDPNNPSLSQKQHTFIWDNVAFDGPFTYRDFSYDALDNNTTNSDGTINLGKFSDVNQASTWNVLNMPANPQATAVRVLFNFYHYNAPSVINLTVNGHAHPTPWPYPETQGYTWRTFAITIPITDLVAGTNVVTLGSDQPMVTSNVNIVLVDVPGGVPVLPGSNNTYPGIAVSSTPSVSPTSSASSTPVPQGTAAIAVTPINQNVTTGQNVNVAVSVNSGSTSINAAQTTISYPSNLLQETGISYGSAFPIQAVETLTSGTILIGRGATTPVSGNNIIATVTFKALSSGTANITLSNEQVFTSATNTNIFSSATGGSITIAAPTPTPSPTPIPTNTPIPTATPTPTKLGDVNHDNVVDLLDFSLMLSSWGTNNSNADINHDGVVNLQDFSILFSHWGL